MQVRYHPIVIPANRDSSRCDSLTQGDELEKRRNRLLNLRGTLNFLGDNDHDWKTIYLNLHFSHIGDESYSQTERVRSQEASDTLHLRTYSETSVYEAVAEGSLAPQLETQLAAELAAQLAPQEAPSRQARRAARSHCFRSAQR